MEPIWVQPLTFGLDARLMIATFEYRPPKGFEYLLLTKPY